MGSCDIWGSKKQIMRLPNKSVVVTTSWDDGATEDGKVAELLAKYGLKGTFYVPFSTDRGVMPYAQLRDLAAGFEIGAHTMTHPDLTAAASEIARREIAASKKWIEDATGMRCRMFCFPGGRFRREHLPMLHREGFLGVRTVELLSFEAPRRRCGVYVVPTTVQVFPHSSKTYFKNAAKRCAVAALPALFIAARQPGWASAAKALFQHCLRYGGVFHLWGHSWEIEEQDEWRSLEDLLAYLHEWRSQVAFSNNAEVCQYADSISGSVPVPVLP